MTIDEGLAERLASITAAISALSGDHEKRKALVALSHTVFALTGKRQAPVRERRADTQQPQASRVRPCTTIDKDGHTCNHPETEAGAQCPGFSRAACARYEPDAPCATCGKPKSGSA